LYKKTQLKTINTNLKYRLSSIKIKNKLKKKYNFKNLSYNHGLIPKKLIKKFNPSSRLNILKKSPNSNVGAFETGLILKFKNSYKNTLP